METLSPATSGSLANFNTWETSEKRRGVAGLDAEILEMSFEELVAITDIEALDAKLSELDIRLAMKQGLFRDYISDARKKGDVVHRLVAGTLEEVIQRIEKARKQLPGMPSYWMNCHRKADFSIHRPQHYFT